MVERRGRAGFLLETRRSQSRSPANDGGSTFGDIAIGRVSRAVHHPCHRR